MSEWELPTWNMPKRDEPHVEAARDLLNMECLVDLIAVRDRLTEWIREETPITSAPLSNTPLTDGRVTAEQDEVARRGRGQTMCNCSSWHNELDFECCCTCHGSSDERQNAANNHARRLCATIARLTEELEATKPCEPCQRDDHDNCTGDCSSMCCALADAERERDSALADLAALRGRVEAAADCVEVVGDAMYRCVFCGAKKKERGHRPGCKVTAALAILSPPEGP